MGIGGVARPKPMRGSSILERAEKRATAKAEEREAIATHKAWASYRCRWPEAHKCRGGMEGMHVRDKSLLGANVPENIACLCMWLHRSGPESIHGKQLRIEIEQPSLGTYGPLSFWRQTDEFDALGQSIYYCVARERSPYVLERD